MLLTGCGLMCVTNADRKIVVNRCTSSHGISVDGVVPAEDVGLHSRIHKDTSGTD